MMLLMFVLWIAVFAGIFARQRWTVPLTLVTLVWTVIILRLHISSDIPLNF